MSDYQESAHEKALDSQRKRQERDDGSIRVHCKTCDGCGRRKLTEIEQATLEALSYEWQSTTAIAKLLPKRLKQTALIGRLNALVAVGLVERRRLGLVIDWKHR